MGFWRKTMYWTSGAWVVGEPVKDAVKNHNRRAAAREVLLFEAEVERQRAAQRQHAWEQQQAMEQQHAWERQRAWEQERQRQQEQQRQASSSSQSHFGRLPNRSTKTRYVNFGPNEEMKARIKLDAPPGGAVP